MRRSAGIAVLAAAAFVCAGGCSFLVDSGGLAHDDPDAQPKSSDDAASAVAEGGSAGPDGGARDGGSSGTDGGATGDASTASDGGGSPTDGGSAPTVGCGAYGDASFCVDFEQANPLSSSVWTDVNAGISLTTASSISPTHSAKIDLASGAPACSFVRLTRHFSGAWTNLRARASVNASRESIPIAWQMHLTNGVDYNILGILYADGHLSVKVQKYDANTNSVTNLSENVVQLDTAPFGTWVDIVLTAQTTPTREARITIGNKQAVTPLATEVPLDNASLSLGLWCDDVAGTVLVDDVASWVH